jgi:predicted TIM-barrel fold metal-dependent hydrolase
MNSNPQRIDVHHHILPPAYVARMNKLGVAWTGGPHVPDWNVSLAREMMERHGIAAAIASVSPGVYWGDIDYAIGLARECNEYLARMVGDDRTHFGGFATLPLPDVNAALRELEHGLDVLGLDGVVLFASQGDRYLGDPAYDELFQELERRSAIVFIHPNTIPPGSDVPKLSLPYGLVEFVFDTTRAVANLLYNGTLERYPSIRYIVSHAGGTVPYLAWRIAGGDFLPGLRERAPKGGGLRQLQRLYYDTALSTSEYALAALRQFVPTSQILFGSDFPYVPEFVLKAETSGLESSKVLDDAARNAINRESAAALFPRFAQAD